MIRPWYWSKKEDERLQVLLEHHSPVRAAKILNRTYAAIQKRMEHLGITTRHNGHDWYTLTEAAEYLGRDREVLLRQIQAGKLKARLYHPENKTAHGWWKISSRNLVDWIQRHPLELQSRDIDMVWFIELLAGVKYKNGTDTNGDYDAEH